MSTNPDGLGPASVDLYWLPLGAGDARRIVRWSGRLFEALVAGHEHRERRDLYHSALPVQLNGSRFVIEMAPVWGNEEPDRGVAGGAGARQLLDERLARGDIDADDYKVRRDLLNAGR